MQTKKKTTSALSLLADVGATLAASPLEYSRDGEEEEETGRKEEEGKNLQMFESYSSSYYYYYYYYYFKLIRFYLFEI